MARPDDGGCTSYQQKVTVMIRPDGTPNKDPICVTQGGEVRWKCVDHDWEVEFEGGGTPVDNSDRVRGSAGQENGGSVTAKDGERFKYTVVVQTEDGETRVDPEMVIGPPE